MAIFNRLVEAIFQLINSLSGNIVLNSQNFYLVVINDQ